MDLSCGNTLIGFGFWVQKQKQTKKFQTKLHVVRLTYLWIQIQKKKRDLNPMTKHALWALKWIKVAFVSIQKHHFFKKKKKTHLFFSKFLSVFA